jgi:hypothetical protein
MATTSLRGGIEPGSIATRQEFATALTAVREAAGLTVREVARAADIHPSTAGGYFSGRHLPPLRPSGGLRAVLIACGVTDPSELDAWQATLARIRRGPGPRPGGLPAPYPGLAPFGSADADRFHGRDEEIRMVRRRLASARGDGGLLVLLGASGSGKTSLLRAGLEPALANDPGSHPVITLTPGEDPLRALAGALASAAGLDPDRAHADLLRSPAAARDLAARIRRSTDRRIVLPDAHPDAATLGAADPGAADPGAADPGAGDPDPDQDADDGPGAEVEPTDPCPVVLVDQLEQAFTLCPREEDRQAFVAALAALARTGPRRQPAAAAVLVCLRSEFLRQAARYPDLVAALRATAGPTGTAARTVTLRPLRPEQVRAAVLEPARKEGLTVDDALLPRVQADLTELADLPGSSLVRLSHALAMTWRRGQRSRLTVEDYQDAGTVRGSIERAAESAYRSLPDGAREAAREVLRRLVRVTPGGLVAGAPVRLEEVDPDAAVIRAFTDLGLLAVSDGWVWLVSTAAIEAWPRSRAWLTGGEPQDVAAVQAVAARPSAAASPASTVSIASLAGSTPSGPPGRRGSARVATASSVGSPGTGSWWAWGWAVLACLVAAVVVAGVVHELWPGS